jgi:glycosyltransferase involved in cell wall biosynthesis
MRLLHVARSLDPSHGGPSESVRMFVLAHQRAGNEVEVASLDAPGAFDSAVNCEVHGCGPGKFNYGYSPRLLEWLRANRSRFDGVIVNGVWQYHGVAARKAFAGERPYVVFAHGMLDPYFRRRFPLKHLKKLVYWSAEEARNLNRSEAVCFTSEEEQKIAAEGFPFRNFRRVVVPYGTTGPDEEPAILRKAFAEAFPALANLPFLLFLGRIHPKKGCDLLIEAFARVAPKELHLVLAGPDETGWKAELEAMARRFSISERVHWTGMIRGQLKWGALFTAQAFILPSHQENFGIAVADALACGLVPLISDQVNIAPDVVADGAGVMEPDTLQGTENLIRRFLALTPDELTRMRARTTECYRSRYALDGAAQTLYQALGLAPTVARKTP